MREIHREGVGPSDNRTIAQVKQFEEQVDCRSKVGVFRNTIIEKVKV